MNQFKRKLKLLSQLPLEARVPFRLSLLITIFMFGAGLFIYPKLQPVIPLFYSLSQPQQQLTNKEWIFLLPGLALMIIGVHYFLTQAFSKTQPLLIKLFSWTTLFIEILILMAFLRIILIVT